MSSVCCQVLEIPSPHIDTGDPSALYAPSGQLGTKQSHRGEGVVPPKPTCDSLAALLLAWAGSRWLMGARLMVVTTANPYVVKSSDVATLRASLKPDGHPELLPSRPRSLAKAEEDLSR